MRKFISIILISISVSVAISVAQAKIKIVSAPTPTIPPQIMMSWSAQNMAPSWYQGKIFPNYGSKIDVVMELLDNGQPADLSQTIVRWYVDDQLVINERNGLGIKNYSFRNYGYPGADINVRVVIVNYQNGGQFGGEIIIPIAHSEIVIDAPYPDREISRNASFIAYPFFFNVPDISKLSFNWTANGQVAQTDATNLQVLNLNIDSAAPSGLAIDLGVVVKNLTDDIDFAGDEINLNLK